MRENKHGLVEIVLGVLFLIVVAVIPSDAFSSSISLPAKLSNSQSVGSSDGYEQLPLSLKGFSISSLVRRGLIHPQNLAPTPPAHTIPFQVSPMSSINWGNPVNTSNYSGSNELGAAMHPTDPTLAISGGNSNPDTRIETSMDGGNTWAGHTNVCAKNVIGGDGVPVWAATNINASHSAFFASLCSGPTQYMTLAFSTDSGNTWSHNTTNINEVNCVFTPQCDHDREYLWTDQNPASPYDGRTYLTQVVASTDGNESSPPSYWSVGVRYTTDQGTTWSAFLSPGYTDEFRRQIHLNEFPALAIEPNGYIEEVWRRGRYDGQHIFGNTLIMSARSENGGDSFATSNVIYDIDPQKAIPWGALSPGGFRWSESPSVAADPVDGTLYIMALGNWTTKRRNLR